MKEKNEKILMNYCCPYCNYKFKQYVGKTFANIEPKQLYQAQSKDGSKKQRCISSQVICPACKNFIKTWD